MRNTKSSTWTSRMPRPRGQKFQKIRIICKTQQISMIQRIEKLLEVSCYVARRTHSKSSSKHFCPWSFANRSKVE